MEEFTATFLKSYPSSIELVEKFGSVIIAFIAAAIAGAIAYRQWKTAYDRLRFDLFEKRFAIYAATMKILGAVIESGNCSNEQIIEFVRSTKGIEFLFDQEISAYEIEVRKKLNELRSFEPTGLQTEAREVKEYLEKQYNSGAREKFSPYLSFTHLKW